MAGRVKTFTPNVMAKVLLSRSLRGLMAFELVVLQGLNGHLHLYK